MSKGISRHQQLILDLLRGIEPLAMEYNEDFQPYPSNSEPIRLTTKGLLLEFEDRGFGIGNEKWKQWQFKMNRACQSLLRRDLIEAYYDTVDGHRVVVWRAAKYPTSPQPA